MPRLFLEAKGVGKNLDDKQFIAQTVNYANNEGVIWCVLTNGLVWRVYKANEPVPMQEKLLFEVDLAADEVATTADIAKSLGLISRRSIADDQLDAWGERVFTDGRVRRALGDLAVGPSDPFIREVNKLLGKPDIAREKLAASLVRVLGAGPMTVPAPTPTTPKPRPPTGQPPGGAKEYPLDHHLAGKPAAIDDLFEQLDQIGRELGADVTRRVRKWYVGYYAGKRSFFTVEVQRRRLLLYVNIQPTTVKQGWDEDTMRDVTNIGHYGMGNLEFSVRRASDLETARTLVERAYAETVG